MSDANDLDLLVRAVADSMKMGPRRWLAKYGDLPTSGYKLDAEHKHLLTEFRQTLKQHRTDVEQPRLECSELFLFS